MPASAALDSLTQACGEKLGAVRWKNDRRVYVPVAPAHVREAVGHLVGRGGRLATIAGVDTRNGVELLYFVMFPQEQRIITVRTMVQKPLPQMASLAGDLPAANWAEREIQDLLGVTFTDHPDPRRLIMADAWPEGTYPYRRDFDMGPYLRPYEPKADRPPAGQGPKAGSDQEGGRSV